MIDRPLDAILVLDKPAGITSARAVDAVKRLLPRGAKIGHAGTLDPFATGVLLLLIGRATKRCETMMGLEKVYEATVKLGATTETDDPESPEQPTPGAAAVTLERVRASLPPFVGTIQQLPPAYSALKVGGKRAADRVRAGQAVQMRPRPVRIDSIEVLGFDWPLLRLRVTCGRGTYIRALARDLGASLGVGGYLTELRRTRIGPYGIERSVTLQRLREEGVERTLVNGE